MSDIITDSAGISGPISEAPKPRKRTASSTRATKKTAEKVEIVQNVNIEEMDNNSVTEDGQKVITGPKKTRKPRKSNSFITENGAIGSRAADFALNNKINTTVAPSEEEKVAIWSSKNIRWTGVGTLSKGYNIVTKEAADVWLGIQGIRNATPEEVASYYGA